MPMQRVCSEDCKGICPMCGKNRNETPCDCKRASRRPLGRAARAARPEDSLKPRNIRSKHFEVEKCRIRNDDTPTADHHPPRARRAEDARAVRVPQLPRAQAAAPRLPPLRTIQGPRSSGSRAGVANPQHADHCCRCNGRRPRPESGSGRRRRGRQNSGSQGHSGGPAGCPAAGTAGIRRLPRPAHRDRARQRADHHGGQRRAGRAHQAR